MTIVRSGRPDGPRKRRGHAETGGLVRAGGARSRCLAAGFCPRPSRRRAGAAAPTDETLAAGVGPQGRGLAGPPGRPVPGRYPQGARGRGAPGARAGSEPPRGRRGPRSPRSPPRAERRLPGGAGDPRAGARDQGGRARRHVTRTSPTRSRSLAIVPSSKEANSGTARPLYERALRIREDVLGPEAAEVAAALNGLGWVQLDLGDLGRRACDASSGRSGSGSAPLGPNHFRTSQTLAHLGRLYRDLGEYDLARDDLRPRAPHPGAGARSRAPRARLRPDPLWRALRAAGRLRARPDRSSSARWRSGRRPSAPILPRVAWILTQPREHPSDQRRQRGSLAADRAGAPDPGAGPRAESPRAGGDAPEPGAHRPGASETTSSPGATSSARSRSPSRRSGPTHPRIGLLLNNLGFVLWETRESARAQATLERAVADPPGRWAARDPLAHREPPRPDSRAERQARRGRRRVRGGRDGHPWTRRKPGRPAVPGPVSRVRQPPRGVRLARARPPAASRARRHEGIRARGAGGDRGQEGPPRRDHDGGGASDAPGPRGPARRPGRGLRRRAEAARLERALQAEQGKDARRAAAGADPGADAGAREDQERIPRAGPGLPRALPALSAPSSWSSRPSIPKAIAKFAERLPPGTLAVQYFAAPDALYLFVVAAGGKFQVRTQAVLAAGPLRPGPRVPHPARAGGGAAAAVGRRRVGGLPARGGAAQGDHREALPAIFWGPSSRSSLPTRI